MNKYVAVLAVAVAVILAFLAYSWFFRPLPDRIEPAYIYEKGSNGKAILFLHQLGGRKEDWQELMDEFHSMGYTVMAIDLRGHGESPGNWRRFSKKDFQNMINDVEWAKNFIEGKGDKLYAVVGASIGANLALNTDAPKVVALSPGLDYRGIKARKRDALIIVGKDDKYSYESSLELGAPAVMECGCHGIELVKYQKQLIVDYITSDSQ